MVEGIIKDNLNGDNHGVSNCISIFQDRMFPYMIGAKTDVVKSSAGVSSRTAVGEAVRHRMENWGFF
jgi:hypothetical protein